MKPALMAIGIPGSGKTTVLKPLAEDYGLAYVNRDDIRAELLGDATDQSANRRVWEEANRRTLAALAAGQGVVLDSTFVEAWKRREMIELLREAGASPIVGVLCLVPLGVARKRNAARERVVPEDVLEQMHAKLAKQPPTADEGFDALVTLDELTERLKTLLPA
ncbi:MAG TPA: ATP-binding protein [Candidatus Paceibacterota bacterium]|nr:ATP-binding protein [Candidatus Paceibacterota bacterium]